jgi:UDP-GlcNAc3NAcA epimerase
VTESAHQNNRNQGLSQHGKNSVNNASPARIVTIVGARPQFVKAFALSSALRRYGDLEEILVHTGQHFNWNMSDVFFAELGIETPKYNLGIHGGGGHAAITGEMLGALEKIILEEYPAAVLVFGDTNSTLAGSLAGAKCGIPVIHVEAGLRSYNRKMPEEVNRVVVDHLSTLLLCPTQRAADNLGREGIVSGVHIVGDLMFDSVRRAKSIATAHSWILDRLGLEEHAYGVATFHRQENLEDPGRLSAIVSYLREQSRSTPLVIPLHPRTRNALQDAGIAIQSERMLAIEPLGYLDMSQLIDAAAVVFTDSGGLQREAYFHRVPCVTLRDETEWIETVESGWNRLWTASGYALRRPIPEYETADVGDRIARLLVDEFRSGKA